jgi:hypothetical protein
MQHGSQSMDGTPPCPPRCPWEEPSITDSRIVGVTRSGNTNSPEGEDGDSFTGFGES